jgi:alpha-N-arabinofuranosidase
MKNIHVAATFLAFTLAGLLVSVAQAQKTTVTVQADSAGKPISPDLIGIFFEDINYSADGGLYAELVQNRSFEYSPADRREWNALTSWQLVQRGDGQGSLTVEATSPLNDNNPHYAVLAVEKAGTGVGLQNEGFDGITTKAGDSYNISLFARQISGAGGAIIVRLESKTGALLGETRLPRPTGIWKKYTAILRATDSAAGARLVVLTTGTGRLALDMVSLFPQKTFRNRPNGLRADLAQTIADLKPKFIRFPGGCLVHGDGLENIYQWKDTIGPVEQRRGQNNIWRYHQSVGLGYYEYFQFCEDTGAKPLPVIAAGVSCQNSHANRIGKYGVGQQGLPMSVMPAYVQDALDLIEWANGPVTSKWGAKRAAASHPKPFNLKYLGVGNEDAITPIFKERFKMIYDVMKAKHPEITVIGTVGPAPEGPDYEEGWKIANELSVPIVDEHYYKSPQWFLDNLARYDTYDRKKSKVYLGEYAAHDEKRRTTLRSALAEAAYMTSLERNGDVVHMASYAPLLGKLGRTQWDPNLIYFTNTQVVPTINYYVQQMFSGNAGDRYLPNSVSNAAPDAELAFSSVRDSRTGDLILKLVNTGLGLKSLHIELSGTRTFAPNVIKTVLTGDPSAVNTLETPQPLVPQTSTIAAGPTFDYEVPPYSLTVIRIKSR